MNKILLSYLATALWSSCDDNDEPMDRNYDTSEIAQESIDQSQNDIDNFLSLAEEQLKQLDRIDYEQIAHEFWLTRNRNGAGFGDGDYPQKIGKALTDISHTFGEAYMYVGDDGKVYIH